MNEYLKIIYLFVVGQGIFLFIFLFARKNLALRIFTSLLFIATFEIFIQYISRTLGWERFRLLFAFRDSLSFLYGILLWFYIRSLHNEGFTLRLRQLLHIVPAALFLSVDVLSIFRGSFIISDNPLILHSYRKIFYTALFASSCIYLAAAFRLVRKKCRASKHAGMAGSGVHCWQMGLVIYFFSLFAIFTAATVLYALHLPCSDIVAHAYCFYLVVPIYATAFMIIFRHTFFSALHDCAAPAAPEKTDDAAVPAEKYLRTKLDERTLEEYNSRIRSFIITKQEYLNPDISVPLIASECGIPSHHVSQTINTKYGKSFHLLMMELRVRHSERLLRDPENSGMSIIEIAFGSGFNSKSNFNMAFRKIHGMTPTEFRKKTASMHEAAPRPSLREDTTPAAIPA